MTDKTAKPGLRLVEKGGIPEHKLERAVDELLAQYGSLKKVLIIPPDYTRCYSCAGILTRLLYSKLTAEGAVVHVMPALGTHMPMETSEKKAFFGDVVPDSAILIHRWQTDTVTLGYVPEEYVAEISGGLYREQVEVEVNHLLVDGGYDRIFSVGQVVPHEVVGMANYSKNLFVGVGGRSMINKSHMLSAICGMEKALGNRDTPARKLYDYAQQHFVDGKILVTFLLTVTTVQREQVTLHGLFAGDDRETFEQACALSQKLNINYLPRRAGKVVAYLNPEELKSTWVGNKGVYRTRMIVEDGGELLLLAPGVGAFGENSETDGIIRKYGYTDTGTIMELYRKGAFEQCSMCAAHLLQGVTDGRFTITYATKPEKLSRQEVEGAGYQWADYNEICKRYDPAVLNDGWHTAPDGEEFYYVSAPATGLWKCQAENAVEHPAQAQD